MRKHILFVAVGLMLGLSAPQMVNAEIIEAEEPEAVIEQEVLSADDATEIVEAEDVVIQEDYVVTDDFAYESNEEYSDDFQAEEAKERTADDLENEEGMVSGDFEYYKDSYYDEETGNYYYYASIGGYRGTSPVVNIPATIDGYEVRQIYSYVFEDCTTITKVIIPDSVTYIGYNAFKGCTNLVSVKLPSGLTQISGNLFGNCSSLISVDIPNGVTKIDYGAFYGCSSLTSIVIPSTVTSMGFAVFSGCTSLTSITIPNGVASIGSSTFSRCTSLTSITIPNSVTSIDDSAFYECSKLSNVVIPNDVTSIGSSAFSGCTNLASVNIPSSLSSINSLLFYNCKSLKNIAIPNSVETIEVSAFSGCDTLVIYCDAGSAAERMASNNGYSYVINGKEYYGTCGQNVSWSYDPSTRKLSLVGSGEIFDYYNVSAGKPWKELRNAIYAVEIGEGITNVSSSAFLACNNLNSVSLPSTLKKIDSYAFEDCISLESIVIPNGVVEIGYESFKSCPKLKTVEMPESVEELGAFAFSGCASIERIRIPSKVKSIYDSTFLGCTSLTEIDIPMGVTTIGENAFRRCNKLANVKLSDSVESIGDNAFSNCIALTNMVIPKNTLYIGFNAFDGCENLEKIEVLATYPDLKSNIFAGCPKVTIYGYNNVWKDYASINRHSFVPIGKTCKITYKNPKGHVEYDGKYGYRDIQQYSSESSAYKYYKVGSKVSDMPSASVSSDYYSNADYWTFVGWYTKASGGTKVTSTAVVKEPMTLYAHYVTKGFKEKTYYANLHDWSTWEGDKEVYKSSVLEYEFVKDKGKVTYSSSNKKIATIDRNGILTVKKKGKVKITAKYNGKSYSCTVKVIDPKLSGKSTVRKGKTISLKVIGGHGATIYSTSNKKIATVDKNGKVKGKKKGKVTITAVNNGYTMTKEITVK